MNDSNESKQQFKDIMYDVYAVYNHPMPNQHTLRLWFGFLETYSHENIKEAFDDYCKHNRFLPRPSEILPLLSLANSREERLVPTDYHRMTSEERVEGLRKLHIAKDKLK